MYRLRLLRRRKGSSLSCSSHINTVVRYRRRCHHASPPSPPHRMLSGWWIDDSDYSSGSTPSSSSRRRRRITYTTRRLCSSDSSIPRQRHSTPCYSSSSSTKYITSHYFSTTPVTVDRDKVTEVEEESNGGKHLLFSSLLMGEDPDDGSSSSDEDDDTDLLDDRIPPTPPKPLFYDRYKNSSCAPLYLLKQHYQNEHGTQLRSKEHFRYTMHSYRDENDGGRMKCAWTCVFVCPRTKRLYPAGKLRNETDFDRFLEFDDTKAVVDDDGFTDNKKEDDSKATTKHAAMEKNQIVFYPRKSHAEHAAAALALDFIQYETIGLLEPRFCQEDPSSMLPLQQQTTTKEEQAALTASKTKKRRAGAKKKTAKQESGRAHPYEALKGYYRQTHQIVLESSCLECERVMASRKDAGGNWSAWTAVFVCPVSQRRFPTGRLLQWEGRQNADDVVLEDIENDDDRIFYRRKATAIAGAAGRACDELFLSVPENGAPAGGIAPRYRYCVPGTDDIVGGKDEGASETVSKVVTDDEYDAAPPKDIFTADRDVALGPASMKQLDLDITSRHMLFARDEEMIADTEIPQSAGHTFDEAELEEEEEEEETNEDFVVTDVPLFAEAAPAHQLLKIASNPSTRSLGEGFGKNALGLEGFQSAIDAANTWLKTYETSSDNKSNPHRFFLPRKDSVATLLRGKAVLAAVAGAVQTCPVGFQLGSQEVATRILDALWETTNARPDTEAYNLFLKCIDSQNPSVALELAETIVFAMKNGNKYKSTDHVLPRPNHETTNTLIQLTAQVGGSRGRLVKYTDENFTPDRESFLSVLSSSIYPPTDEFEAGGFDPDFARECIQRMEELMKDLGDASYEPDTQVYNAPLPWTGGPVLWSKSRPYARYIPWENYGNLYTKTLRSFNDDDLGIQEAQKMEDWLTYMEGEGADNACIAPDIETYEAVIQGWLKTVTQEGLDKAESIINRLISSFEAGSLKSMRLETFHPMLSAWYHSKTPEASDKVLEWLQKWKRISQKLYNDPRPDVRLVELEMTAYLKRQTSDLKKVTIDGYLSSRIKDDAVHCSRVLEDACQKLEQDILNDCNSELSLEALHFALAIRAWRNVALLGRQSGDAELLECAISETTRVISRLENLIRTAVEKECSGGVALRPQSLSRLLSHLLLNSQYSFCEAMTTLADVQCESGNQTATFDGKDRLSQSLLLMEKMARVIGEFEEIEACVALSESEAMDFDSQGRSKAKRGKRVFPGDQFVYGMSGDSLVRPSRKAFLWQVVKFLEQHPALDASHTGEVVRLCLLVKDIGGSRHSTVRLKKATDSILNRTLPSSVHRVQQGLPKFTRASARQNARRPESRLSRDQSIQKGERKRSKSRRSDHPSSRRMSDVVVQSQ